MVGSQYDDTRLNLGVGIRTRDVYCGDEFLGSFPLAENRDPDPTDRTVYLEFGSYEFAVRSGSNGKHFLLDPRDAKRIKKEGN